MILIIECGNCLIAYRIECVYDTFNAICEATFCPSCSHGDKLVTRTEADWQAVIQERIEKLRSGKCWRNGGPAHQKYVDVEIPRLQHAAACCGP